MKRYLTLIVAAGALAFAGCQEPETRAGQSNRAKDASSHTGATMDIVETAMAAGNFETLVEALKAADLVDTLKGRGPFTVFAPTDEAFDKLPAGKLDELLQPGNTEQLRKVLTYHVVSGKVSADEVARMSSAKTLEGERVSIQSRYGAVMIDDAKVTKTDIECSNGVIHVINKVLTP